jgi:hypothetical protein
VFRRLKSRKDAVPRKVAAFGSAGEMFSLDTLFHRRRLSNFKTVTLRQPPELVDLLIL